MRKLIQAGAAATGLLVLVSMGAGCTDLSAQKQAAEQAQQRAEAAASRADQAASRAEAAASRANQAADRADAAAAKAEAIFHKHMRK